MGTHKNILHEALHEILQKSDHLNHRDDNTAFVASFPLLDHKKKSRRLGIQCNAPNSNTMSNVTIIHTQEITYDDQKLYKQSGYDFWSAATPV